MPFSRFRTLLASVFRGFAEAPPGAAALPDIQSQAPEAARPEPAEAPQADGHATVALKSNHRRTLLRPRSIKPIEALSKHFGLASPHSLVRLPEWVQLARAEGLPSGKVRQYELGKLLGQGGMGQVFLAFDGHLGREAAVKLVLGEDPELTQRSLREARAQARVDHPNICRVYETGEWEGQAYIAMQFIRGNTLDVAGPALTLEEKLQVMIQVAEGLHAAHCLGMVHRDMKPGNVMIERIEGQRPKPYVMDFGLVRDSSEPALTVSGMVMGTPAYMSPEQARGDQHAIDRRSDVYSLGATLYALLAGRHPFSGGDFDILVKVIQEDPVPLRTLLPELPQELETIVIKAMEKDQGRRFDTAQALAEELRRFLEGEKIQSVRPGPWLRLLKWARKNRVLAALSASALAALLAGTSYVLFASYRSSRVAEYSRTFGILAERIEFLMRAAYLRPAHPIEVERSVALARMQEIQVQATARGRWAKGPGNYAIGRAYLTLGDLPKARTYLELARSSGLQGADLDLAQGLVLAKQFQQELQAVTGRERQQLAQHLDASLRRPALWYLTRANTALAEGAHYAQALMAYIEGHYPDALQKLAQAKQDSPWPFEAHCLEANVHLTLARQAYDGGEDAEASQALEAMKAALDEAQRLAPSSPEVYALLATYYRWRLNLEPPGSAGISLQHAKGVEAANSAIALDSMYGPGYFTRGELDLRLFKSLDGLQPKEIEKLLSSAQASLTRAIELGGGNQPKVALASLLEEKVEALGLVSDEARRQLDSENQRIDEVNRQSGVGLNIEAQRSLMTVGMRLCEDVLHQNPRHEGARYWLAQFLFREGVLARDGRGGGFDSFKKATAHGQQLVENNPNKTAFRLALGAAAVEMARAASQSGQSPENTIRQAIQELRWGRERTPSEDGYGESLLGAYMVLLDWQAAHGGARNQDREDLEAILQWPELAPAKQAEGRSFLVQLTKGGPSERP